MLLNIKHRNILIALTMAVLFVGAVMFSMAYMQSSSQRAQSLLRGVKPGSNVEISWVELHKTGERIERQQRHISLQSDEDGAVRLPPIRRGYDFYQIQFESTDGGLKTLAYSVDHGGALIKVTGQGFGENEFLEIGKYDETYETRADWSGAFSRDIAINAQDFKDRTPLRFAFLGQLAPDTGREKNPNIIDVVVAVGGGASQAQVNIYEPPIGTCTTVNNTSIFPTSTCDADRMNEHIVPQPEDEPGTIETNYVVAMMLMGEQLSAVMMQQMEIIGQFFDAKEQQETQREFRRLVAQAHKDYHPGEQMCEYGTFSRSLSHSEETSAQNKRALNQILMTYYRQPAEASSASPGSEITSRIEKFKNVYCDPNDFNGALWLMCEGENHNADAIPTPSGTPEERGRFNKDIQYYATLGRDLTLKINYDDDETSEAEEDIIALAKNLYWPVVYEVGDMDQYGDDTEDSDIFEAQEEFTATRSNIAKTAVAHNSFASIVGMKSEAREADEEEHGAAYMKALLKDFGMEDGDIHEFLGDNPSYYAQMEMLTKIMYQHPNFYTNLYDKPANVDRMNATMEAIQLMQGRDRHEGLLRQEMLISQLVEQGLRKHADVVNDTILDLTLDYFPPKSSGYD